MPAAATPSLLDIDRLNHRYGNTNVLSELSLQLAEGEIGCLLGSSGCGKTTVLRCIAGFESIRSGSIAVAGEMLSGPGTHLPPEKRRIGMVFQDYALFPHLDIAANIGFGVTTGNGEREARVNELLQLVGMAGSGRRYPHEISGGQQQRVALARALAPRPRLLLMDEPFSNLDVALRERLSQEVREIIKLTGTTAILVTHDQNEAFAMADRVGVMRDGRIEQWDAPYKLYHEPTTRYVADFIGQGAFIEGRAVDGFTVQFDELGSLQSRQPLEFEDPRPMQVLLRPDDVVHDDASPVTAEVVNRVFRGAEFLYTLRLSSGAEILSLVPSHHNHAIGERIGIRLDADHVITFRDDPGLP